MLVSQFKSGKPTAQFKVNQAILCAFVCICPKQWLHFIIMLVWNIKIHFQKELLFPPPLWKNGVLWCLYVCTILPGPLKIVFRHQVGFRHHAWLKSYCKIYSIYYVQIPLHFAYSKRNSIFVCKTDIEDRKHSLLFGVEY